MKIAFIGGGNMAEAMISAVLSRGLAAPEDIAVSDISTERRSYLKQKYKVYASESNLQAIRDKDSVVLAVKPQILDSVMPELKDHLEPDQLVISILAGKNIRTISAGLSHNCIVRSMPNTPAQISEGMTVWTATPQVNEQQKKRAASILGVMGKEIYVDDEKYLDMATAVSGSGPAYVFLFVESLIEAAVKIGFSPEIAQTLVMQTLTGAGQLIRKSGQSPRELRRMVTSPGGTTAEAIAVFEKGGFSDLVQRAVTAAYEKAKKLGS
ncbi:MAG: pyrroline-5-carboxylate reductase [Dehalococcoidales bacterium]|nr:pyrroline-5-carboxylate reductase [Dehalococcoidales bacterium]